MMVDVRDCERLYVAGQYDVCAACLYDGTFVGKFVGWFLVVLFFVLSCFSFYVSSVVGGFAAVAAFVFAAVVGSFTFFVVVAAVFDVVVAAGIADKFYCWLILKLMRIVRGFC
jgi:hypothetical protein